MGLLRAGRWLAAADRLTGCKEKTMGELWRVAQFIYPLLNLAAIILFAVGLFAVLSWPGVPGKGFLVTALALLLVGSTGYLLLASARFLQPASWVGELTVVASMLFTMVVIAGYGFLLAGLFALRRFFRTMLHRNDVQ